MSDAVAPPLPDAARNLVERLRAYLEPQDRFRGLWLTGSIATGTADRYSDVDSLLVVRAPELDEVLADWPQLAAGVGDLVYLKRLGDAPVFNHVLDGWLRWDVVLATPETAHLERGAVRRVFDKDASPLPDPTPTETNRAAALAVTEEFVRCLGLLPVVVGRDDGVGAQLGSGLLRQHLVVLLKLRAEGGRAQGALHLRRTLPPADYALLTALPAPAADVTEGINAHQLLTEAFLPVAREVLGDAYPDRLVDACLRHLHDALGDRWR